MKKSFDINYYPAGTLPEESLTYVIIGAREGSDWIYVRHKERESWELPAGHIEEGEQVETAARRELFEETGVTDARLEALHDYYVEGKDSKRAGRLYIAEVVKREKLPESEIAEIRLQHESPEPATYPDAHISFLKVLNKAVAKS